MEAYFGQALERNSQSKGLSIKRGLGINKEQPSEFGSYLSRFAVPLLLIPDKLITVPRLNLPSDVRLTVLQATFNVLPSLSFELVA
ncbi:hypothetical protein ALP12_200206 [Pseudomonas savastanoi pv. phaseolicola]|nr:hypothetical protein ALP12_200206 [Pseudomonas savastanoi pv. phaseolicola]